MSLTPETVDPDVVATIRELVSDAAEKATAPEELWAQLDELGLARLTAPESDGGSGATWRESAVLLTELAAYGVSAPAGEHDLLAGWLLREAGLPADAGRRTVAVLDGGAASRVPWAAASASIVCLWSDGGRWRVADVPTSAATITPGTNSAGEPRDLVAVGTEVLGEGKIVSDDVAERLRLRGALLRAIQVAGALESCVSLTVEHVTTRRQFGRPLAAFQAVQQQVADMAAEATLARVAVDRAVDAAALADGEPDPFAVAVARSCSGHAASLVVRHAHQLHGAIGTTQEHALHLVTMPALAWRAEFGTTESWDARVAAAAAAAGPDGLWDLVTKR